MKKAEARKYYREQRAKLGDAERMRMDDLLLIRFQSVKLPFIEYALSYWPMAINHEVNTHIFTDYLAFVNPGLKTLYPVTNLRDISIQAMLTGPDTRFRQNRYHIFEPEDGEPVESTLIDLVLVPMLICDRNGHRAGYGKGFYDRFLKTCRADCIKIGLSYFKPVDRIEDTGEFDVPLDFCITPETVYVF